MRTSPRPTGPGSFTPEQRLAVEDRDRRTLLVGFAGSGKTEVLIQRLARILMDSAGESFRCLTVTYTVKAAQELRGRIEATAASEYWRVDADTLHGFALEWLRQYGDGVDIGPDVVVYADDADRARLIYEYVASLGLHEAIGSDELRTIRPVLTDIDSHRTLKPGTPYPSDSPDVFGIPMAELYEGYLESLDRAGGIDFPGMLTKLLAALDADPWIGDNFRSLFRHVLVDEAQDLTPAQTELLRCLIGDNVCVFAVADDRQSINGFAGGSFENARLLVGPKAASRPLSLPHNFRSSTRVLQAAERLATHFSSRSVEASIVDTAPPGTVAVVECTDPPSEARAVGAWVSRLFEHGLAPDAIAEGEDPVVQPEDIAVIGRTRWVLDPVLAELESRGIGCAVQVGASGFLETPEGRIVLDTLAIEVNTGDAPAKRRLCEELAGLGVDYHGDHIAEMRHSTLPTLESVAELIALVRDRSPLDEVFACLNISGTTSWTRDAAEISTLWANYRAATQAKHRSLSGFLRHVNQSQRVRPSDPGVRVMTIHKVKGLEFRSVAVVGVREGTVPDYRAQTPEAIDAERRSLYVAMTRAARDLFITWPRTTLDRYGRTHTQSRSRFLDEAGL